MPRGDQIAKGHIVAINHDENENMMKRSHTNPVFDTKTYQAKFAGGKVTELTANVIC